MSLRFHAARLKRLLSGWVWRVILLGDAVAIGFRHKESPRALQEEFTFVRSDNLGDFILWLPSYRAVRAAYPRVRMRLIANAAWAAWAKSLGEFDDVVAFDRGRILGDLAYRWRLLSKLAQTSTGTLYMPIVSRVPAIDDSLARAILADRKVASCGDATNADILPLRVSDRWYHALVPMSGGHELYRNQEFLAGAFGLETAEPWPRLTVTPPLVGGEPPYCLIAPGVRADIRRWPAERFALIADRLAAAGLRVMLVGAPSEQAQVQEVWNLCVHKPEMLAGRTDLAALQGLITGATLLLTNETGIAHMSAALCRPTFVVVGGGHFNRFVPYPPVVAETGVDLVVLHAPKPCYFCNWRCTQPHARDTALPCIEEVLADDVWAEITKRLR